MKDLKLQMLAVAVAASLDAAGDKAKEAAAEMKKDE